MLEIGQLEAGYGAEPVLKSIDLRVNEGELVAVLGANGAGKSTLMAVQSAKAPPGVRDDALPGYAVAAIREDGRWRCARMFRRKVARGLVIFLGCIAHGTFAAQYLSTPIVRVETSMHSAPVEAIATDPENRFMLYVERWLKAPMLRPDGALTRRTRGTPQGGPISPLIANIFLHVCHERRERLGVGRPS